MSYFLNTLIELEKEKEEKLKQDKLKEKYKLEQTSEKEILVVEKKSTLKYIFVLIYYVFYIISFILAMIGLFALLNEDMRLILIQAFNDALDKFL